MHDAGAAAADAASASASDAATLTHDHIHDSGSHIYDSSSHFHDSHPGYPHDHGGHHPHHPHRDPHDPDDDPTAYPNASLYPPYTYDPHLNPNYGYGTMPRGSRGFGEQSVVPFMVVRFAQFMGACLILLALMLVANWIMEADWRRENCSPLCRAGMTCDPRCY